MARRATWKRRVAQWKASGLTAAEYVEGRGYAAATLKWWSSRLNTQTAFGERAGDIEQDVPVVPLARVIVRPEPVAGETPIAIERRGIRILVRRGFDADVLRRVLVVLATGSEEGL